MNKTIKISELQFHLRNDKCKVSPTTIDELPFYLSLKHDNREIYDNYYSHTKKVCPHDFHQGNPQDYLYFKNLYELIKLNGWDNSEKISVIKNPRAFKVKKNHTTQAGDTYLVTDGMHRLSILYFLHGDVELKLVNATRKTEFYTLN